MGEEKEEGKRVPLGIGRLPRVAVEPKEHEEEKKAADKK